MANVCTTNIAFVARIGIDRGSVDTLMHQDSPRGRPARLAGIARRLVPLAAAAMLSACSSTPDWINPVAWFDNVFEDDLQELPAASPEAQARVAEARAQQAGNRNFPQLRQVPERPAAPSSAEERELLARGLVADRDNARYTDQQLRAGNAAASPPARTETTGSRLSTLAPPPPPRAVTEAQDQARSQAQAATEQAAAARARVGSPAPAAPNAGTIVSGSNYQVPSIVQRREPVAPPPPIAATPGQVPAPETAAVAAPAQTAALPAAGGNLAPVAPPPPTGVPANPAAMIAATPNPALDTSPRPAYSVSPVPPAPYATAALAAASGYAPGTVVIGGGGVSAGYQTTGTGYATAVATAPPGEFVVYFGHGSTQPLASSNGDLRAAAAAAKQRDGYVRVIGHASQRTGNMKYRKHIQTNFNVSLDRAEAVARALARLGVDRRRIIVEARGDSEPVYYEFMPTGEARNRRAEIYIE